MFKQYFHTSEVNKAKKVIRVSLVAGDQSAIVLQPRIEPFNLPPPPVSAQRPAVLRSRLSPVSPMRRYEGDVPSPKQGVMRVAVIGAVSDEDMRDAAGESRVNRGFGKRDFMGRGRSDLDGDRQACAITNRHYLAAFSAFCLSHA